MGRDRRFDLYTAMPYISVVHTVLETPTFLRDVAQSGMSEDQHERIARQIAENPTRGDIIPGTGGARKVRFAGRGKGKSGGYRVITYFAANDVPVLLLALIDKGERAISRRTNAMRCAWSCMDLRQTIAPA